LEELAAEYQDEIVVYKVNTDNDPELAQAFGITSIPTLIFIPLNGSPEMAQGALPKDTLKEVIEKVLLDK
jgi:thioredoxin-like negative regulator of GroEL